MRRTLDTVSLVLNRLDRKAAHRVGTGWLIVGGLAMVMAAASGCAQCKTTSSGSMADSSGSIGGDNCDLVRLSSGRPSAGVTLRWYCPGHCSNQAQEQCEVQVVTETGGPVMFVNPAYEKPEPVPMASTQTFEHTGPETCDMILGAGRYTFEYEMPWRRQIVGGEIWVRDPDSDRAQAYARLIPMIINPGGDLNSVLTEDDLMQVTAGHMVTKVVFVADLRAIEGRIAYVDRELQQLEDVESRMSSQERYWSIKRNERRRNAMASGDQGWGEDVPAIDLAFYQVLVGSERYHLERFNQADNQVHAYEKELSELRLPQELLRAERSTLRSIMGTVRILNQDGDLIIATPSMTGKYHDSVYDLERERKTLGAAPSCSAFGGGESPQEVLKYPYFYSWAQSSYLNLVSYTIGAPAGLNTAKAAIKMSESEKSMGEVLFVIRVGPKHSSAM